MGSALVLGLLAGWFALQPPARRVEAAKLVENYFERNKRIDLLELAWDLWQLSYGESYVSARPGQGDRTHLYGGAPRATGFPHAIRVLSNAGYVVGYSDALENPVWAAYRVRDLDRLAAPPERPEKFEVDLRTAARVPPGAYTNSGYDRGHLAPNYAIATRYGAAAQRETFLMSNIVPQRHALNAGPWKDLEMKIATNYPGRFGEVWVLTGPIFGPAPRKLGNGTAIPDAFFLIVVDESDGRLRVLALVVPQEAGEGQDLARYVTTVDEIERRTGLDFLAEIEDAPETLLESRRAERLW